MPASSPPASLTSAADRAAGLRGGIGRHHQMDRPYVRIIEAPTLMLIVPTGRPHSHACPPTPFHTKKSAARRVAVSLGVDHLPHLAAESPSRHAGRRP